MSTKAAIAYTQNNKVRSIYCHFDGDLIEKTLKAAYNDSEKAKQLIERGDIVSLKNKLEDTITINAEANSTSYVTKSFDSINDWLDAYAECEFFYLFEAGVWLMSSVYNEEWRLL